MADCLCNNRFELLIVLAPLQRSGLARPAVGVLNASFLRAITPALGIVCIIHSAVLFLPSAPHTNDGYAALSPITDALGGRRRRGGRRIPRWRDKMTRKLALYGCGLLLIVVLTHVAEIWQIFPFMGWGQPDSPGHYLAMAFAISAAGCFLASFVVRG